MSDLKATCPCGHTVEVTEPEGEQTLYGSLAYKMARHEPCNYIDQQHTWKMNHGHEKGTSVEGAYNV